MLYVSGDNISLFHTVLYKQGIDKSFGLFVFNFAFGGIFSCQSVGRAAEFTAGRKSRSNKRRFITKGSATPSRQ